MSKTFDLLNFGVLLVFTFDWCTTVLFYYICIFVWKFPQGSLDFNQWKFRDWFMRWEGWIQTDNTAYPGNTIVLYNVPSDLIQFRQNLIRGQHTFLLLEHLELLFTAGNSLQRLSNNVFLHLQLKGGKCCVFSLFKQGGKIRVMDLKDVKHFLIIIFIFCCPRLKL